MAHDNFCILLGALHQRSDFFNFRLQLVTHRGQAQALITRLHAAHSFSQHIRALAHVGERLRTAHQSLRRGFRQSLRLHQRLTGCSHLLRNIIRLAQRKKCYKAQHQHRYSEQHNQNLLVLVQGPTAKQREG